MATSAELVRSLQQAVLIGSGAAGLFTLLLTGYSLMHPSRAGPEIRAEVLAHFRVYLVYSLARLAFWVWAIAFYLGLVGNLFYLALATVLGEGVHLAGQMLAAATGICALATLRFLHLLRHSPATLLASFSFRYRRLDRIWRHWSTSRLRRLEAAVFLAMGLAPAAAAGRLSAAGRLDDALLLLAVILPLAGIALAAARVPEPAPCRRRPGSRRGPPNILLIGSDTLRADRLGMLGYRRNLTPFIDGLARRGTGFTHCYVPCARTAPSLASLLTGCWPHTHGIRDNFVGDAETRLTVPGLPGLLRRRGYRTVAVSDWCGADLGKFPFGFDEAAVPEDPWNLKLLLRQGPKDLRLFLSLFSQGRFGRRLLPEIHDLAGVPLTRAVGCEARRRISRLAEGDRPFFLDVFMAATHPPFGSEYPYYSLYTDPAYEGDSRFVMARLTDPWEVLRRQADPREAFDLDQIIDLYDGCVRSFDREVEKIVGHLEACGLREETVIVIYSDHGFEFFEHGTWGQGNTAVADASARIPLILSGPGVAEGRRVDSVVRSVDLAPTLLELAGAEIPGEMEGRSLVPCLDPGREPEDPDLPAFNETGMWLTRLPVIPENHRFYPDLMELLEVPDKRTGTLGIRPEYRRAIIAAKDRMVRRGRWKLTCRPLEPGPSYQLFDMAADPDCRNDVLAGYPAVAWRLRAELDRWILSDPLMRPCPGSSGGSSPPPSPSRNGPPRAPAPRFPAAPPAPDPEGRGPGPR